MATSNSKRLAGEVQGVSELPQTDNIEQAPGSSATSLVTTALVLGGIALVAPELIAGMAIGAGVTLLSGRMPTVVEACAPR